MIVAAYLLGAALMIAAPLALAAWLRRRASTPVTWGLFLLGTASFVGAQLVHLPLLMLLERVGALSAPSPARTSAVAAILLGLSAGLCEETARLLALRALSRRTTADALMLGLGHGGVETMLVGGVGLAAAIGGYLTFRSGAIESFGLSAQAVEELRGQLSGNAITPNLLVAALFERAVALALHLALSLIVLRAFVRGERRWFAIAVGVHGSVDALAAWLRGRLGVWELEALVLAIVGATVLIAARSASSPAWSRPSPSRPAARGCFAAALGKELCEWWRTRRALGVLIVFAISGMLAPLSARFAPELVSRFAGSQGVTSLVPVPSVAESLAQLVKQGSQLGFVVVLVAMMGAVVSEKERGTAAMVLCKPLPRSVFLLTKWIAHTLILAGSLTVAVALAALYTRVLFGRVPVATLLACGALLYAWLVVYATMALLASALARNVTSSAAIAIGLATALAGLGTIPRWGGLFPSGLIGWAALLAAEKPFPFNFGACAMAAVLVALAMIGAVAWLEREEF